MESRPELDYPDLTIRSAREIVHLQYSAASLPAPPSDEWTRFVCISDTHSRNFDVPDGDVLLHSGDLTMTGTLDDFEKTMEWITSLPHKIKIIIAGNHDLTLHTGWYDENWQRWHRRIGKQKLTPILELLKGTKAMEAGVVYLQSEQHEFRVKENGRVWTVYGSPWSPAFFNWAFNYDRDNADEYISKFPQVDILLTHGPAFGIFDRTRSGDDVGCETLAARLSKLRPRIHVVGHIHEAHGAHIHGWDPATDFAPPLVQNGADDVYTDIEIDTADNNLQNTMDTYVEGYTLPKVDGSEGTLMDTTVFVNAANWPSGKFAWKAGKKSPFGGPYFQPVVVDLKD